MTVVTFNQAFGVQVPLVQGPMGGVAGPALVAAVCEAGALGDLPIWAETPEQAETSIKAVQQHTSAPFAANLRSDMDQQAHIALAADLGVNLFHLFWGDPDKSAASIRARGCQFIATVSDEETTKQALDAGAAGLVAQGMEAGGHVWGEQPLSELLDSVLTLAQGVPVIAAGGIVEPSQAKAVVERGAGAVLCGTRFVATQESLAHDEYKQALLQAEGDCTVRSLCFDLGWPDAPHRTLINSTYQLWEEAGFPPMGERPGEEDAVQTTESGGPIPRYIVLPPTQDMRGDILAGAMYAGTGAALIADIPTAAEAVKRFAQVLVD